MDRLFSKEDSLLRGYLHIGPEELKALQTGFEGVEEVSKTDGTIFFRGNGYVTDGLLYLLKKYAKNSASVSQLKTVDLSGCSLITDHGIKYLCEALEEVSTLEQIIVDGCDKLTEHSGILLSRLKKKNPCLSLISMSCTKVKLMSIQVSPLKSLTGALSAGQTDYKFGHVLIVPQPTVNASLLQYIVTGVSKPRPKGPSNHLPQYSLDDWTVALTDIQQDSSLFEYFINARLAQVIIPFDAKSDPREIMQHISETVSRVMAKEAVTCPCPSENLGSKVSRPFMDVHRLDRIILDVNSAGQAIVRDFGILSTDDSDPKPNICSFISKTSLTRSNPKFEMKALPCESNKVHFVLGAMFDILFADRFNMDSQVEHGGFVDGIECNAVGSGKVFSFGIEGSWLSEYIPHPEATFYFEEDGVRRTSNVDIGTEKPQSGMYPVVCILAGHQNQIALPDFVHPSYQFTEKMKKENRWIEKGWIETMLIDKSGRITALPFTRDGKDAIFVGRTPFSERNASYSIRLDHVTNKVVFGAGSELIRSELSTTQQTHPFVCLVLTNSSSEEWECANCHIKNPNHVNDCVSCATKRSDVGGQKRGFKVQLMVNGVKTDLPDVEVIQEGETIEVQVASSSSEDKDAGGKYMVTFLHKNKKIAEGELVIKMKVHPAKCVPIIHLPKGRDSVVLDNYIPLYRPVPYNNRITVGVTQCLNVMDNGEMTYVKPRSIVGRAYGHFVAKKCLNKDLLEFEVELLKLSQQKMMGIGLVGPDFPYSDSFIGWSHWAVALHGDNGGFYFNETNSRSQKFERKFNEGSVIKVRVVPLDDKTPLKFDEVGDLQSQQEVKIEFLMDDVLVYSIDYEILSEGIYPAFSCKDVTVRVKNFYPETNELWESLNEEQKGKTKKEDNTLPDWQTEFLAVAVTEGSDGTGKTDLVQQQLDIGQWKQVEQVDQAVERLEQNLSELDLQGQQQFSQLCAIRHNLQQLKDNPRRISFKAVDLSQSQDQKKLQTAIVSALEQNQKKHNRMKISTTLYSCETAILEKLKVAKVIKVSQILKEVPVLKKDFMDGVMLDVLLSLMHSQGKCLLVDTASDKLVLDVGFSIAMETRLGSVLPTEMKDLASLVPSISSVSHVWARNTLADNIFTGVPEEKMADMRGILRDVFGVYVLKCIRTQPTDDLDMFVQAQHLANQTQASLFQYWENKMDRTNFTVMRHTYRFPVTRPAHILPLLVATATKYTRVVLLTSQGAVFQNGSVQTVIILHTDGDDEVVVVESRCYMPEIDDDSSMSKETSSYVSDYTWNVFCIFTDIIDDCLTRLKVSATLQKDTPQDLVNVSIGCKHNWTSTAGRSVQSVCTLCNNCCDKGDNCTWNNIMAEELRHCGCKTTVVGCQTCGICIRCAQELWGVRTRLRPFGLMMTEVSESLKQKTTEKKDNDPEDKDKQMLKDPVKYAQIPLDPHIYNEVELLSLDTLEKALCLKEESAGSLMQAYPGRARYIQTPAKIIMNPKDHGFSLSKGDAITVRLSDPLGVTLSSKTEETSELAVLQIEPQYFATHGREVKVIHETGIVMYDTTSASIPVGQFIACKPMTKKNNHFSIKILKTGNSGTIAMGLVPANYGPNRQPGWNSQSIAYHADDGGIFLESGSPTRRTHSAAVGDLMQFEVDFDKNKGWFRKNGEKMIELNLNPSRLGFYPSIGFHSLGEAVQIVEKDLWVAENESQRNMTPPAFSTYKYGNVWISPGEKVTITSVGAYFTGWVVLHNPKKDQVGFKVQMVTNDDKDDIYHGILGHKEDWMQYLKYTKERLPSKVVVEWISLESGRTYTNDDMELLFAESQGQDRSSYQHILPVVVVKSSGEQEMVPTTTDLDAAKTDRPMLQLEVLKNRQLLETYWVKYDSYLVSVETNNANFLLRYPKCPTFTYPRSFQKGMKLCAYIDSAKAFYECVVVEVYPGGKNLALEYSPKDKNVNMTICVRTNSSALLFDKFDEKEDTLIPYQTRNTPASLHRTFVHAPPYLLSEGGKIVQNFIDREAKANTLRSVSSCVQVFTRLTVQEHQIWHGATHAKEWIKTDYRNHLFAMLPEKLNLEALMYPKGSTMFKDISVHRMCFPQVELTLQAGLNENVAWQLPIHFVDIPGMKPNKSLPLEATFGDGLNGWTYVILISSKLRLPSYTKMIEGSTSSVGQEKIEHLLHQLLQVYASLCGIYSAPWGGIEYAQVYEYQTIKDSIRESDNYVTRDISKPHTDSHILVKNLGSMVCKAHFMTFVGGDRFPEKISFTYDYFKPYNNLVTMFFWSCSELEKLADDFFEIFPNLQFFRIGDYGEKMHKLTSIPSGMSKAKHLKFIEITNTAMTSLPDDLFLSPSASSISCANMSVKTLPTNVLVPSPIEELVLSGLELETIPPELGNMEDLSNLELCYNPFTDLPQELTKLTKLKTLMLTGSPWFILQGKKTQITYQQYMTWFNGQQFLRNHLGDQYIETMFHDFDFNRNGSLDEEEISALNMKLFFDVARLGIKDINDEVTGGIPPVVFKLKSLTKLYLDFTAITCLPPAINNLQNLTTLSLSHCPLLESLPGSLGHLPNISEINVSSCPMLRTPPTEIVSRGFESVKAYLKRLASGFTECRRTKLMVVGLGGAGKTSLLRALMSQDKQTGSTESEIPTDGIDIVPWTVQSEDGHDITYSTWDFAGQAVYYNTHQFFLSKRAVYMLLWSMRQGYEHAGLDFWLSSICCHAPGTPIMVIGTQCDLIPQAEIPENELMERYPQIVGFHQVSSIKGIGISELQKNLIEVTLQQGYMGEKIPKVWLNLEKRIIVERMTKSNYIKWEVAKGYALEQGIYDEKDVRMCVQLLHDLGTVQYFDNDFLRDYVVINPQWIVDVMACVVSAQDSPIQKKKGRFYHSDILTVWQAYDPSLHQWLLRLTEDFDLTFPLPKEPVNVVPCLLPGEPPEDLKWPSLKGQSNIRETRMVYRFTYLPSGLFNRAQVRLFQFSDGKMVWKKGSMLSKNSHLALLKQTDNTELVVMVQGPNPENILFLIHEVFESIIEESFNGVSYDLFVPCPDCELKGTAEPDLLNSKLIQRAKDCKAPFLQCYKYFHWVSMALLQEKLPTSDLAEFDVQLQQSIVALQDLIDKLVMDVAIIYSPLDIPAPGDTEGLSPFLIRDDILSWGHSCWCADDMDKVDRKDLIQAVRTCRVLVAIVSDNFERDTKCSDIFLNALETMNKEIIPIQVGKTNEWEQKDLGMKIGSQARKLMALNVQRYTVEEGRRHELKLWLQGLFADNKEDSAHHDVFLSYARANSRKAMLASNRPITNAVGYGDPRDMKTVLDQDAISCWIDSESIGLEKEGIYSDMAAGIRNSKVMLACISDEYANSSNCMMELRFAIFNINLPLVVAIVGTGNEWKETEAAMLLRRAKASEVYLQVDNPEGYNVVQKYVKEALKTAELRKNSRKQEKPADKKGKKEKEIPEKKEEKKDNNVIAYQEEFELIQRKFMRHIIGSMKDELPLPRLLLADFIKSGDAGRKSEDDGRDSKAGSNAPPKSKKLMRPKTATRSRDRLQIDPSVFEDDAVEDWVTESFCIRVLCEHEGGWHLCMEKYPLAFRSREHLENFMKKSAPYLHRIYTLLKQSPINLNCFSSSKGKAYLDWIQTESQQNVDFVTSMAHIRSSQFHEDSTTEISCLSRCRLPSGKVVWLCEEHQKEEHVVKLSVTASSSYITHKVLFTEDKLLLENIEKADTFKKLKSIKSTKTVSLPPPVPIPSFQTGVKDTEALLRQRQEEDKKVREARELELRERAEQRAKEAEKKEPENTTKTDGDEKPDNAQGNGQSEHGLAPGQKQANTQLEEGPAPEQSQSNKQAEQGRVPEEISKDKTSNDQVSPDILSAIPGVTGGLHVPGDKVGNEKTSQADLLSSKDTSAADSKTSSDKKKHIDSMDSVPEQTVDAQFRATTRPKRRPSETFDPTSSLHKLSKAISSSRSVISSIQQTKTPKPSRSETDTRSLKRGSTVRNLPIKDTSLFQNGKKGNSKDNFETLAPTLLINTINNPSSESTSATSSASRTDDGKPKRKDTHPMERVRPRKIQVKPKGQGQGASGGQQLGLPHRQGSQACLLQ